MNGVTYADALVKARRYEEMMTESSVDGFFVEAANVLCEAAIEENIMLDEEVNFDVLVEAVVNLMSEDQLAMENAEDFVMEAVVYILNEFKKVKEKKAAEKAAKLLKRATQSELAGGKKAEDLKKDAGKAVLKAHNLVNRAGGDEDTKGAAKETLTKAFDAVKKSKEEGKLAGDFAGKGRSLEKKEKVSDYVQKAREQRSLKKIKAAEAAAKEAAKKNSKAAAKASEIVKKAAEEKNLPAVVNQNTGLATIPGAGEGAAEKGKNVAGKAMDWIKKNPGKAAGIGAGVAAATAGGIYAAKKIADRKKAAAAAKEKEEVKENYEYPEYTELVEFVVANMTEDEIMQENASEFACEVADYMIESQMIEAKVVGDKAKETIGSKLKNAADTVKTNVGNAAKAAGTFVKNNPGKTAAIGAGVAATGAAAAIAAKKIADKKKAAQQNQEEVKENYEYEEYETLVEAVIGCFMSEEEIMSENASQIAIATADYLVENIDSIGI